MRGDEKELYTKQSLSPQLSDLLEIISTQQKRIADAEERKADALEKRAEAQQLMADSLNKIAEALFKQHSASTSENIDDILDIPNQDTSPGEDIIENELSDLIDDETEVDIDTILEETSESEMEPEEISKETEEELEIQAVTEEMETQEAEPVSEITEPDELLEIPDESDMVAEAVSGMEADISDSQGDEEGLRPCPLKMNLPKHYPMITSQKSLAELSP